MADKRSGLHYLIVGAVAGVAVTTLWFYQAAKGEATQSIPPVQVLEAQTFESVVVAPGTVEPLSEEFRVGSALAGRLAEMKVQEGDWVAKGQVLAVLENDHLAARVAMAEAEVRAQEADLERLLNGARPQERREIKSVEDEAVAQLALAKANRDRLVSLAKSGYSSLEQLDQVKQEYAVAQARLATVRERLALINAPAREDEVSRAKANLALAKAKLEEARAIYEKSFVRAPIAGRILRRYKKPGEVLPELVETPIVSLGDTSILRVRAEVDERDVARLKAGFPAYVTADAFGSRKFKGQVVRIGQQLGRKGIRTDEPTERLDTKVLETLIELDPDTPLIPGLRVNAFIEAVRKPG